MGILRKALFSTILGTSGAVAYLGATQTIVSPLPANDPVWASKTYARHNPNGNPVTQDVCIKRIPLNKIRPDLLKKDGALATEFCRGVWSSWGFAFQRRYLERKWRGPETANQLWTTKELSESTYEEGTKITDHFEIVEKTPNVITVRCGDSPRNRGLRDSDGLFFISVNVDEARGEVELGLKSCFFHSKGSTPGTAGPMPGWMEELHQWYSRIWMESGSWRLTK
ncbi:hypothetical protein G7046_g1288 [Stylonectria norvegica]|nr:hypothetical protein G7046_g1288 [Stylonectria norvegica]